MIRGEFFSNFIKTKRTPFFLLQVVIPIVMTALFLMYYAPAGYRILPDVRLFFVLLQIVYPIYASIPVVLFINLDRNISNMQNSLGVSRSRVMTYLGKLLYLLFFSAVSIILFELCMYIGTKYFLGIDILSVHSCIVIFFILFSSNLFLYFLYVPIAFRFGSSITVLVGIMGMILAGYFENKIGDKIWMFIPWEWGVRFLKSYFKMTNTSVVFGMLIAIIVTLFILGVSLIWFRKWGGTVVQE